MKHRLPIFAIIGAMIALLFGAPALAVSSEPQRSEVSVAAETQWSAQPCYAKGEVYYFNAYGHDYVDGGTWVYYLQKLTVSTTSNAVQDAYFNVYDEMTGQRLWPNENSGPSAGYSLNWVGSTQNLVLAWFKIPASHFLRITVSTTEGAKCGISV
jgi:hypothetical protein